MLNRLTDTFCRHSYVAYPHTSCRERKIQYAACGLLMDMEHVACKIRCELLARDSTLAHAGVDVNVIGASKACAVIAKLFLCVVLSAGGL